MPTNDSFANQLLVAMPSLGQSEFQKSVIYLCEHQSQGSVGIIINKPMTGLHLSVVFQQLQIKPINPEINEGPILFGGPLQPERGFVIHKQPGEWRSSLLLQEDVSVTTSNDIIRAIAEGKGPKDTLVALGYVGWTANQLEAEVMSNHWLLCPYNPTLMYEVPFDQRWAYAGQTIGVNMYALSTDSGHA